MKFRPYIHPLRPGRCECPDIREAPQDIGHMILNLMPALRSDLEFSYIFRAMSNVAVRGRARLHPPLYIVSRHLDESASRQRGTSDHVS